MVDERIGAFGEGGFPTKGMDRTAELQMAIRALEEEYQRYRKIDSIVRKTQKALWGAGIAALVLWLLT